VDIYKRPQFTRTGNRGSQLHTSISACRLGVLEYDAFGRMAFGESEESMVSMLVRCEGRGVDNKRNLYIHIRTRSVIKPLANNRNHIEISFRA
jgi:hypothetical protein